MLPATEIVSIRDDHHNISVTQKGILIHSALVAQAESRPTLSACSSLDPDIGGKLCFQHPVRWGNPHSSTPLTTFNAWCATYTGHVLLSFKQAVLAQIQVIWSSVPWRWGPAEELPCPGHHQLLWQRVRQWRRRELWSSCMEWWKGSLERLQRFTSAQLKIYIPKIYAAQSFMFYLECTYLVQ